MSEGGPALFYNSSTPQPGGTGDIVFCSPLFAGDAFMVISATYVGDDRLRRALRAFGAAKARAWRQDTPPEKLGAGAFALQAPTFGLLPLETARGAGDEFYEHRR